MGVEMNFDNMLSIDLPLQKFCFTQANSYYSRHENNYFDELKQKFHGNILPLVPQSYKHDTMYPASKPETVLPCFMPLLFRKSLFMEIFLHYFLLISPNKV